MPSPQLVQLVAPVELAYVPAAQSVQAVDPDELA